jgi:Recombinational DNA repair protein (RecF pathway)
MKYSSKLVETAVQEISKLPGIGKKTALRLVLHILKQPKETINRLGESLIRMRSEINYCRECFNISDHEICAGIL